MTPSRSGCIPSTRVLRIVASAARWRLASRRAEGARSINIHLVTMFATMARPPNLHNRHRVISSIIASQVHRASGLSPPRAVLPPAAPDGTADNGRGKRAIGHAVQRRASRYIGSSIRNYVLAVQAVGVLDEASGEQPRLRPLAIYDGRA